MSFRQFIYYCSVCGAWGAFITAVIGIATGLADRQSFSPWVATPATAALLGLMLGGLIGGADAMLNANGFERILRVGVCGMIGLFGGLVTGLISEAITTVLLQVTRMDVSGIRVHGWILVGLTVGASVGIFDIGRALATGAPVRPSIRKTIHGILGGLVGGILGGILFDAIGLLPEAVSGRVPRTVLTVALVILGACVGVMIGLAQVILKEAWVKVEKGFRPGREMMITKEELTIGRAEACDVGLFGDNQIEKLHARIVHRGDEYLIEDNNTPAGTYLNDRRVTQPTPLHAGDLIRVGSSYLRFGERAKRK